MAFREMLHKITGIEKEKLPNSYQIVGDIVLLKLLKLESKKDKKKIALAILELFPRIKTVCEIKGVENEYRTPKIIKLAGNGFETVHREHGISFQLDVLKIMFSKGNLFERQRLISQAKSTETVMDMFAGIGYFSLGIAKKVKKVYAVEKNPLAFSYLKKNVKLNKINNIVAINTDCRKVELNEKVDRIIMGYFPNTENFLPYALRFIDKGVVHFHNSYKENELWEKPLNEIKNALKSRNYKILYKRKVKSIAPRTYHVVIDILML